MNVKNKSLFFGIIIGFAVSAIGYLMTAEKLMNSEKIAEEAEKQPLYWVAPMDATFQR